MHEQSKGNLSLSRRWRSSTGVELNTQAVRRYQRPFNPIRPSAGYGPSKASQGMVVATGSPTACGSVTIADNCHATAVCYTCRQLPYFVVDMKHQAPSTTTWKQDLRVCKSSKHQSASFLYGAASGSSYPAAETWAVGHRVELGHGKMTMWLVENPSPGSRASHVCMV